MTNKFISKGKPLQSEPGPLASVDHVLPEERIRIARYILKNWRQKPYPYSEFSLYGNLLPKTALQGLRLDIPLVAFRNSIVAKIRSIGYEWLSRD
jgi:hypothetical protein